VDTVICCCPCCKKEFPKQATQRITKGAQKYTIFTCPACDILVAIPQLETVRRFVDNKKDTTIMISSVKT
jgi:hypothetical protein